MNDHRIGSLVVNPGGPGGSGVDYAASATSRFGPEILAAFDVVGFDPRGVGTSTPLECVGDKKLDELIASDPDPDTPAETKYSDYLLKDLGNGCLRESGPWSWSACSVHWPWGTRSSRRTPSKRPANRG